MISRDLFLLFGDHAALLLLADAYLDKGAVDVVLRDIFSSLFGCEDGCLIQEILQICAGEPGRGLCHAPEVHVVSHRLVPGVDFQDVLPAFHVRPSHRQLPVKTARTKDRRIQDVGTVGGCQDDDAFVDAEAVHLHQHLVQRLLALVVSAAEAGTSPARDSVDLVNENDTGRQALRLFKKIAHSGRADTDEHFHEVRTGNGKERHACLSGHCLCEKGLSSSGRSHQDDPFRDPGSHVRVLFRILQEINDLLKILLFLVQSGYRRKVLLIVPRHPGPALPEIHHLGVGTAAGAALHHPDHSHGAAHSDQSRQ